MQVDQQPQALDWMRLHIDGHLANTPDQIRGNVESALARDYIPFNDLINTKSGAVAVVGSGPSLKKTWKRLKNFKGEIIACNAACQFLLEKGITPTYMFCFDADPLMLEFMTPHPEITYLIASRCPPEAFELIKGCRIVCWHAAGDEELESILLKFKKNEPMVVGGGAAVTRAMVLAIPMGYRKVHIFGGDSSFSKGDTHIRQSTTKERIIPVKCAHRVFLTAPWMAKQVEDFKMLSNLYRERLGIEFIVHGDGLLPHVAMVEGFKTDYIYRFMHFFRRLDWKARTLWQHI